MTQAAGVKAEGWLAELHPAYFALVMATGIVSIAAKLRGVPYVPTLLFVLNLVFLAWSLAFFGLVKRVGRGVVGVPAGATTG